ncbi:right-handed parallel beta-helix repeat-containing protein, partial [Bartonella bovis]|uniref:right-handed parallel beta-helix repeat-containing protein n=1 Tax=Bartonella bovis TaxID=155194 RepID=UPI003CC80355
SGKVNINGDSTITVANSGTGIMVSGSGATVKMMEGGKIVGSGAVANIMGATIKGSGATGTGLYVMGTATMNGGEIKDVESGVYATGTGNLTINGGAKISFTGRSGYGVRVGSGASADLTNMTIAGSGATGTGVIKDGTGTMTLTKVDISKVKVGIQVTSGNLTVN